MSEIRKMNEKEWDEKFIFSGEYGPYKAMSKHFMDNWGRKNDGKSFEQIWRTGRVEKGSNYPTKINEDTRYFLIGRIEGNEYFEKEITLEEAKKIINEYKGEEK